MIHTARQAVEAVVAALLLALGLVGVAGVFSTLLGHAHYGWVWASIGLGGLPFLIGGSLYWLREIAD